MNGGVFLLPYGEWVLLIASLVAWAEKMAIGRFMLGLGMAWTGGKIAEGFLGYAPLHWNVARLAVIVVFFVGAWRRSSKGIASLAVPSLVLVAEELLLANEPGIIPLENWLFLGALFLTAWLSSRSYWGMAAAVAGSLLVKEALSLFVYGGLFRHQDVPDPFYWHAGTVFLLVLGMGKLLLELREESLADNLDRSLEKSLGDIRMMPNSGGEPEL